MLSLLTKFLSSLIQERNIKFILKDNLIKNEDIFSDKGLLPALARRADNLCSFCFQYGIGINFEEDNNAILGVKVVFDDVTPFVVRVLFLTEVVEDLIKLNLENGQVVLDELLYE